MTERRFAWRTVEGPKGPTSDALRRPRIVVAGHVERDQAADEANEEGEQGMDDGERGTLRRAAAGWQKAVEEPPREQVVTLT